MARELLFDLEVLCLGTYFRARIFRPKSALPRVVGLDNFNFFLHPLLVIGKGSAIFVQVLLQILSTVMRLDIHVFFRSLELGVFVICFTVVHPRYVVVLDEKLVIQKNIAVAQKAILEVRVPVVGVRVAVDPRHIVKIFQIRLL